VRFLSPFIDKLQATFPPNRVAILLAAPITAAAAWISATIAANVPGVELPVGVIAAVMLLGALIVVRLLDKWFDQWQAGEPIDVGKDLEAAFEEIVDGHQQIDRLTGTAAGVKAAVRDLHDRLSRGEINEAQVVDELKGIFGALDVVAPEPPPEAEVASPADAAPPTATTPS
jgi:hypothetical protein